MVASKLHLCGVYRETRAEVKDLSAVPAPARRKAARRGDLLPRAHTGKRRDIHLLRPTLSRGIGNPPAVRRDPRLRFIRVDLRQRTRRAFAFDGQQPEVAAGVGGAGVAVKDEV